MSALRDDDDDPVKQVLTRGRIVGRPLTAEQRSRLLEVAKGVPVLRKRPVVPDPRRLHPGQLVRAGGTVWRVVAVGPGSAEVRGEVGPAAGRTSTWSPSSAGHRFATEADVAAARESAAEQRARERDEARCANCWGGDGVVDGEDRGRDPHCPDHQVSPAAVDRAVAGAVPRRGREEDPADVAKVLELRAAGMAWHQVEKAMGWPDTKGGRPWRIAQRAAKKG